MKFFAVLIIVVMFMFVVWKAGSDDPGTAASPGSSAVYQRIAASTDCRELAAEFDQAYENHQREAKAWQAEQMEWSTGYMDAAYDRQVELGCFG